MARPIQSEPSLGLDRRQLLASAAALSIGTVPGIEAAAEVTNLAKQVPSQKSQDRRLRLGTYAPGPLRKFRKLPLEI